MSIEWLREWEANLASTGALAVEREAYQAELVRLGESEADAAKASSGYVPDPKMLGQAAYVAGLVLAIRKEGKTGMPQTNLSHTDAAYRVLVASSEERQRIEQLVSLAQTQPGWRKAPELFLIQPGERKSVLASLTDEELSMQARSRPAS